ncbi:uncharacterized protein [Salminus brasiliensis]|uniref:uncharacterized protein isoform X2 n=1 Tax=Salminus brasiliensis TaxID=930266 RepID=UPI003B83019A
MEIILIMLIWTVFHQFQEVQSQNQKPIISIVHYDQLEEFRVVCELPLAVSERADFRCHIYTGNLQFLKGESQRLNSGRLACRFTAPKKSLFSHLQSARSREVSCDYSLKSDTSIRSPMSDKYDLSDLLPVPTLPSTPEEKSTADLLPVPTLPSTPEEKSTAVVSTEAGLPAGSNVPSVAKTHSAPTVGTQVTHHHQNADPPKKCVIADDEESVYTAVIYTLSTQEQLSE